MDSFKEVESILKAHLVESCEYAVRSLDRREEYISFYESCEVVGLATGKEVIGAFGSIEFHDLCEILEVEC